MSQKTLRTIHLVYGIALSVFLFLTAGCFIGSCIAIYNSGDRPFSRESIALAFDSIALPVYLTIIAIVGSAILSLFLPFPKKKTTPQRNDLDTLRRLEKRLLGRVSSREPSLRLGLRITTAVLSVALAIYPACLFFDPSRFTTTDVNGSVIAAVIPSLVWAGIAIVLCTICSFLCARSVRREIALCKAAISEGKGFPTAGKAKNCVCSLDALLRKNKNGIRFTIRAVLLVTAVVFLILGVLNGGADDVLGKAIRICTECIGLG